MRILLIEDHRDTSEAISRFLKNQGHDVVTATTLAEAAAFFNVAPFDMLVCDLRLPDGDGWGLARMARARSIPAVALSALARPEDIERSRSEGFVSHIIKPIPLDDLERILYEAARTYIPQYADHHGTARREAFHRIIQGMTTEELNRLSAVLKKSTQDLSEELAVLQEKIAARNQPFWRGQ